MKIAVVDVGGGMRDCYGAGIFDYLLDEGITFDLGVGVSAGANNIGTFMAGQRGRMKRFYQVYPNRREYMGLGCYLKYGNFLNMKYIFDELPSADGEDPFDVDSFERNPMDFYVVATEAESGEARHFHFKKYNADVLKASCCLPVVNKAVFLEGVPYYDGGLSDPIPYEKAFSLGAEKVVVILTRPESYIRDPKKDVRFAHILSRKYPEAGKALLRRAEIYNTQLEGMKKYEKEGRILCLSPDDTCGVTTLSHKSEDVERLYQKGYRDAFKVKEFLE